MHGHKGQLCFSLLMPERGAGSHAAQMEMTGSTKLLPLDENRRHGFHVTHDAFWNKQCLHLLGCKQFKWSTRPITYKNVGKRMVTDEDGYFHVICAPVCLTDIKYKTVACGNTVA